MNKIRYNNQFIIKHAFYFFVFCIFATLILYRLENINIPMQNSLWRLFFLNLHDNLGTITNNINNIFWIRIAFVLLTVSNIFFVPLLKAYFYNRKNAQKAVKSMDEGREIIKKELAQNYDNYEEIVKRIEDKCHFSELSDSSAI